MSHADDLTLSGAIGDEAALRRSASDEARTGIRNFVRAEHVWVIGATAAWLVSAVLTLQLPNTMEFAYTEIFSVILAGIGLLVLLAALAGLPWAKASAPWFIVLGVAFGIWELLAAKFGVLPQPFFPPPQALLEVYLDDWQRLAICVYYSVQLLLTGYLIGAFVGFVVGIAIGWSKAASYWIHPVLRFIGPLPAVAWLPLAFFTFPSSWSASVFLIALATGFLVAILTWSGVAAVPSAYYDVARTLGANERFLVLKVAVPAAMPSVFVGLFMGLSASFAVLVVAEMMGVKAGLGWYLQWAQGWAAYNNLYAALAVMSLMCTGLVTLLFKVRDRLLGWQKGLVRW